MVHSGAPCKLYSPYLNSLEGCVIQESYRMFHILLCWNEKGYKNIKIIKISHSDLINKVRGLRSDVNALAARQECHWSAIELALYWSGEVWQGRCKKKQIVNEENGWRESVQATIYPLNKWKMSQSSRRLLRIACKVSKNNNYIIICSTFQIWEAGIRQFGAFFEN